MIAPGPHSRRLSAALAAAGKEAGLSPLEAAKGAAALAVPKRAALEKTLRVELRDIIAKSLVIFRCKHGCLLRICWEANAAVEEQIRIGTVLDGAAWLKRPVTPVASPWRRRLNPGEEHEALTRARCREGS